MSAGVRFSGSARSQKNVHGFWRLGLFASSIFSQISPMCGSIVQLTNADELRIIEQGEEFLRPDALLDIFPVHIVHRRVLPQHQLAVFKLQGIGMPRLGDANDRCAARHLLEDRVLHRKPQRPDVRHAHPPAASALAMIGPLPPSFICLTISS